MRRASKPLQLHARRASLRGALWSLALAVLAGCAHVGPSPQEALRAGNAEHASGSELGLAALVELDRGNAAAAAALLSRAPDEETATNLVAKLLTCKRALDAPCQARAAMRLLERFPRSAMATLAAETLQRVAGLSLVLDDELMGSLPKILGAPAGSLPDLDCQQRLRDALATLSVSRLDYARAQALREQSGLLQDWEVLGPLSPYHYLEFDTPLGPERQPDAVSFAAPWSRKGSATSSGERWRPLRMNNGQLPLGHALDLNDGAEEGRPRPPQGDLLYARTTVQARGGGLWLRVESSASLQVFLDGKRVLERDLFRRVLPRVQWLELAADDGPHRLLVKAAVGDSARSLRIASLPRSQGRGPPSAAQLSREMQATAGAVLGHELAALAIAEADPHAALAELTASNPGDAALGALGLAVRAELWGALGTLTDDDARGRSQRDVDAWITRDTKSPEARLRRSLVFAELNRLSLAQQDLDAVADAPTAILVARARLQMQRDAVPLAIPLLRRVLATDAGDCPALELMLGADDTANAFAQSESLSRRQASCPGGSQARAQFLARTQGPRVLVEYWRGRVERSPGDPEAALQLADALEASSDTAGAAAALERRLESWPGDGAALRRKAALEDMAGDGRTPSSVWSRLLALEPSDLQLRRALALLSDQPEPLEALLPSVPESLAAKRWVPLERAPSETLLDSGAAWLHLDGTITERVRSLEVPLDENALGPLGELDLPPGAALLALRTHKADGRVLDADAQVAGEKRTISAPSLQVGDTLEIDYLMTTPPPRRGLGGAAEAFYFTAGDSSLQRSIYRIGADDAQGQPRVLELDRHRIEAPARIEGIVTVERTHVSALPDEPSQPPQSEFFPWVQVGSGATANDLARSIADQVRDKTSIDEGLRAIIEGIAALPERDDASRAAELWATLSSHIRVEGGTLSEAASEVVGRGSGDLVLPMLAALRGLGIPSHLVLVSGPAQTRETHRFARLADYGDVLLRIEPHGSRPIYLAAAVRDAPFGRIPPNLCGAPALVLPEGDASGQEIILPDCADPASKRSSDPAGPDDHLLELQLTVAPDGSAEGAAREVLYGFEASAVRGSIEQLDDEQRRQGVESALAAVFTGVALSDLSFQVGHGQGAPLSVSYRFHVPDLADREAGGTWSLPLKGFPAQLQERFAQLANRRVPLMVAAGERPRLSLTLHLPAGAAIEGAVPADVWIGGPSGTYLRRERREGTSVTLSEKLALPAQRVSLEQYPTFAGFAQQVDGAQGERVRYRLPESGPSLKPSGKPASGSGSLAF